MQLPYVQQLAVNVNPSYLTVSIVPQHARVSKTSVFLLNECKFSKDRNSMSISPNTKRKINHAVSWLAHAAKKKSVYSKERKKRFYFKLNFVTLTIPLVKDPPTAHRVTSNYLKRFIRTLKYKADITNYVWRLEFQKNGMPHLHIIFDKFIHYKVIRGVWNSILFKEGLLSEHFEKFGNYNPNSTDVHSIARVKNIAAYISKYITKKDETNQKVTGRVWGCNYELSYSNRFRYELNTYEEIEEIQDISNKAENHVVLDFGLIIKIDIATIKESRHPIFHRLYSNYLFKLRTHSNYNETLFYT